MKQVTLCRPADIEDVIRDIISSDMEDLLRVEDVYSVVIFMKRIEELMLDGLLKEINMELSRMNDDVVLLANGIINVFSKRYCDVIIKQVFFNAGNIRADGSGRFSIAITVRKGVSSE